MRLKEQGTLDKTLALFLKPGLSGSKAGQSRPGAPDGVKQSTSGSAHPSLARSGSKEPCHQCQADHGPKWQNCVHDVTKKGSANNAYAVCTTSVGQQNSGSIHQTVKKPGSLHPFLSPQSQAPKKSPQGPALSGQEGGPGSGRHAGSGSELHAWGDKPQGNSHSRNPAPPVRSVGDAVSAYNDKVKKKLSQHTVKQSQEGGPGSGRKGHHTDRKGGEKSHGASRAYKDTGDVVGKTTSGKPINKNPEDKSHKSFNKQDHMDAERLHNQAVDHYAAAMNRATGGAPIWDRSPEQQKLADDFGGHVEYHMNAAAMHKRAAASMKQSGSFNFLSRFKEASATSDGQPGKRFRVTLLQEGMGNLKDAFYYTREAIASAVPLFEGRQFFIDHPDEIEEQTRPERSVRDLAGYFENVSADLEESGLTVLSGDLVILPDPSLSLYRTQMLESLQYSQKHPGEDLVGLSINASGDFDTVPIQEFMGSGEIPEPCLVKLNEAMQKGVQVVRPVREMSSAVSCDLVTVAGAGGKINQLLEGGKKHMEKKEGYQAEAEGEGEDHAKDEHADGADGQDGSHPDAKQDEELIKSLLQKYLGDGFSDEDHQMMSQHMAAAKEMGLDGKEAEDVAGHSMKMAKHLMSKQAKQGMEAEGEGHHEAEGGEAHPHEAEEPKGAAMGVHGDSSVAPADSKNSMKRSDQVQQAHKESGKGKGTGMTELVAKVARLEQELEKRDLKDATEKALRESGLSRKATSKFRESVLPTIRSVRQLNEELKKFQEAFRLGSETETTGFVYSAEKTSGFGEAGGLASGFGDCVEE